MKQAILLSLLLTAACGHVGASYAGNEPGNLTVYLRGGNGKSVNVGDLSCSMSEGEFVTVNITKPDYVKVWSSGATGSGKLDVKPGDYVRIEPRNKFLHVKYIMTKMPPAVAKNELIGLTEAMCLKRK